MEGSVASCSLLLRAPAEGKGKNHKFWSTTEEEALLVAMKELIVDGWKSGNGWRPGFYKQCAAKIRTRIPGSLIRGEPHVLSKITAWKKDFFLLRGLFGKSGQGLHPLDYSLTVIGTPAWIESVKVICIFKTLLVWCKLDMDYIPFLTFCCCYL